LELPHAWNVQRGIARLAESTDIIQIDTGRITSIDAAGLRALLLAKRDALANASAPKRSLDHESREEFGAPGTPLDYE